MAMQTNTNERLVEKAPSNIFLVNYPLTPAVIFLLLADSGHAAIWRPSVRPSVYLSRDSEMFHAR